MIVIVLKLPLKDNKISIENMSQNAQRHHENFTHFFYEDSNSFFHHKLGSNKFGPKFDPTYVHAFLELCKSPIDWNKMQKGGKELVFFLKIVATRFYISLCFLVLSFCVFQQGMCIFLKVRDKEPYFHFFCVLAFFEKFQVQFIVSFQPKHFQQ